MKSWFILWFLTLQKLPYFFVLFFFLRGYVDILVVGSTESFN
ncbi:NADH dehydrogenase subunit 2 [Loa loa]|uniref:NADH dehydrogenase subunit 2 n=1 Tax=Loa loa TaxID=7209 RepID=A0A1S0TE76_LOALO|nr:NADH dehydrogenase subunit 2 [Loa loa]EFO12454.1 NADH dehydrogenase subunit 2 [Loa loa]